MRLNRHMLRIAAGVVAGIGLASFGPPAGAQNEPRVQLEDLDVTVDAVGNAKFVDKVTRSAMEWEQYKQNYGGNPSLLKRDLQHHYSSTELRDISLANDDMNRVSTLSWTGDATTEYIGNGQWEGRLPKGAKATKVTETLWEFTTSYPDEQGITQETFHIHLPKGAQGAEQAQNETGDPVLRYSLPDHTRSPLLWIAMLLGVLGVALVAASFLLGPPAARGAAAAPH
ncbi:MAG TPA: hypothetical protein VGR80_12125 [Steroidobacteraceae bacterium]|nr:hypothetical protein [Steroidobacteraceae bacterium]